MIAAPKYELRRSVEFRKLASNVWNDNHFTVTLQNQFGNSNNYSTNLVNSTAQIWQLELLAIKFGELHHQLGNLNSY